MNVAEFKSQVHQLENKHGFKYKILYKGYKDGLENSRLHVAWHKPLALAEVTVKDKVVYFEITGNLKAVLVEPSGDTLESYDGVLTPYEGIMESDDDIAYLETMAGEYILFDEMPVIKATCEGREHIFETTSIVEAIFDTDTIARLAEEGSEPDEPEPIEDEPEPIVDEPADEPAEDEPISDEPEPITDEPEPIVDEPKPVKDTPKPKKAPKKPKKTERETQTGNGRCDLLPLDIVGEFFECEPENSEFEEISRFQQDGDYHHLISAAKKFSAVNFENDETVILEYACQLEEDALKHGDRDWEKGIPMDDYIDSGIRHLLKHRRGDADERHDRAFIWDMLCGAWTKKHLG